MNQRRILLLFAVFLFCISSAMPQNGAILLDSLNLKVVKVWGTHQQRGYAYGYLCGTGMTQIIDNYVKPVLGANYTAARNIILAGTDLEIDTRFQTEAQGIIDGMNAAGTNTSGFDATDVLVGNCLLDLRGLLGMKNDMGCSSLMNWGDATLGTDLDGKSVISRHLDWQSNSVLLNNQIILIQQPSEADEQNWAMIGFEGMISALSGINNHMGTFHHVMDDYAGSASQHNKQYKPVWFAMRQGLERSDYNNDGSCNVQDIRSSLSDSPNGFADAYIVSALSENNTIDSLVALVAEICPASPTHVFRSNSFPDSIPGDNLYTANYQIARNNAMNFCIRYNSIRSHLGNGDSISLAQNWTLMRDFSHLSHNVQFMLYSPEMHQLRVAVRQGQAAYLSNYQDFNSDQLLNNIVGLTEKEEISSLFIYPNPAQNDLYIGGLNGKIWLQKMEIIDIFGRMVYDKQMKTTGMDNHGICITDLIPGAYILRIYTMGSSENLRFIKE
jgi:hypothetical protein